MTQVDFSVNVRSKNVFFFPQVAINSQPGDELGRVFFKAEIRALPSGTIGLAATTSRLWL